MCGAGFSLEISRWTKRRAWVLVFSAISFKDKTLNDGRVFSDSGTECFV